jgi:MFS superfamily sulfate permease-like transporter
MRFDLIELILFGLILICAGQIVASSADYVRQVMMLAFLVGVLYLAMGVFMLGFVVSFISTVIPRVCNARCASLARAPWRKIMKLH